jgi:hypothetical protein
LEYDLRGLEKAEAKKNKTSPTGELQDEKEIKT